jgi:stage III sporulation protein AD
MEIFKLCFVAFATAICAFVLKVNKSELVPLCLVAGGVILLLTAFDYLTETVNFIKQFTEQTGIESEVIRLIFKLIGIGYLFELTASSIQDLGFSSLADKLLLCGKLLIFVLSIPVFKNLYNIILSLVNLL